VVERAGAATVEQSWAERVRANRDQVERIREVPDGRDFYAPVTSLFRADPRRTDEPVLDLLRGLVEPGETWLDIGAGAGRYALPIALLGGKVIALDPSTGMLDALRAQMAEFRISNIRPVEGRWPPDAALAAALGPSPVADVALIAHVGYDVEGIGAFVEAMEDAARRLCVALLMERQPASVADPFWPPVHGEARVSLPALPDFLELLRERGADPAVTVVQREPRTFESPAELDAFLRRQLWIADGGEKERRYHAALEELVVERSGGFGLRDQKPMPVGVAVWRPRTGAAAGAGNRWSGATVSGP
jgi:SAM-dependent methyltransferase